MPVAESKDEMDASHQHTTSTPMNSSRNSGGSHGELEAETESEEEESDLEQQ